MRYWMLYLVIHSSASHRPWVRIPETTPTSFRSIWIHWCWSLNLESHAQLAERKQTVSVVVCKLLLQEEPNCDAVPKSLVVKASFGGHPGRVPAGVLVLIRADDLVVCYRSRFKAQGSVVGAFCSGGQVCTLKCFHCSDSGVIWKSMPVSS